MSDIHDFFIFFQADIFQLLSNKDVNSSSSSSSNTEVSNRRHKTKIFSEHLGFLVLGSAVIIFEYSILADDIEYTI